MLGDGDRAFAMYQMLNPLMHASTAESAERYKVEPYVIAADVYTAAGQHGRGGWTWYTGSASWMYRVGLESLLGFNKRGDLLTIEPRVPETWPAFTIDYRYGTSVYTIEVRDPAAVGRQGAVVSVDGVQVCDGCIRLINDGKRYSVIVRPTPA
jgi:cyclic beta-1,2-glucan synthetase